MLAESMGSLLSGRAPGQTNPLGMPTSLKGGTSDRVGGIFAKDQSGANDGSPESLAAKSEAAWARAEESLEIGARVAAGQKEAEAYADKLHEALDAIEAKLNALFKELGLDKPPGKFEMERLADQAPSPPPPERGVAASGYQASLTGFSLEVSNIELTLDVDGQSVSVNLTQAQLQTKRLDVSSTRMTVPMLDGRTLEVEMESRNYQETSAFMSDLSLSSKDGPLDKETVAAVMDQLKSLQKSEGGRPVSASLSLSTPVANQAGKSSPIADYLGMLV